MEPLSFVFQGRNLEVRFAATAATSSLSIWEFEMQVSESRHISRSPVDAVNRKEMHKLVSEVLSGSGSDLDCLSIGAGRSLEVDEPLAHLQQTENPTDRLDGRVIFVVDDDDKIRDALRSALEEDGRNVEAYSSCEEFLESYVPGNGGCLLLDAYLPEMPGLELLRRLRANGDPLPAIMISGDSDVTMVVEAMKVGASDFIEKPVGFSKLIVTIAHALEQTSDMAGRHAWQTAAKNQVRGLTSRQRQIMELVLAGCRSKNIAVDLGISQRTVENHRASIMKRTGTKSLPALARLALAATWEKLDDPRRRIRADGLSSFARDGCACSAIKLTSA